MRIIHMLLQIDPDLQVVLTYQICLDNHAKTSGVQNLHHLMKNQNPDLRDRLR